MQLLPDFPLEAGVLRGGGKVCVPRANVREVMHLAQDATWPAIFHTLRGWCDWTGSFGRKARDVKLYCLSCPACQLNKDGRVKPFGTPQPLEIPELRCRSVSMDFVTHLQKTENGCGCITTFHDRLSKCICLVPFRPSESAENVTTCFFHQIFRLHGLPYSPESIRDPKFTSRFWSQLVELCRIRMEMSMSKQPPTEGFTERVNRIVSDFFSCYCNRNQRDWDDLLTSAGLAYNSSNIYSLRMTPFVADLGWELKSALDPSPNGQTWQYKASPIFKPALPPLLAMPILRSSSLRPASPPTMEIITAPPSYKVGHKVFLSRKLLTTAASKAQPSHNLGVKRYGRFEILEIVVTNVIRVELPHNIHIHPIVPVEHTARVHCQPTDISNSQRQTCQPFVDGVGDLIVEVDRILARRKRGRRVQFLTLYKGSPDQEVEWNR